MKIRLVSHKLGSASLKRIQEGLSTRLGYRPLRASFPKTNRKNILYGDCKDKIYQYKWFAEQGLPSLQFTTDAQQAVQWLNEDKILFARKLIRSSEGKGIVILEKTSPFVLAPVYTIYKKKKREFRIHIYKDSVVQVLEKRKKSSFEGTRETKIRNTANGYVFCSENVHEPEGLRELALKASKVTSSFFKGVDIGYNEKNNELFVIEVNSAPGIEGSNVTKYIEAITS